MIETVNGCLEPFSDEWLDALDKMPKDQALDWIDAHIKRCSAMVEAYARRMFTCADTELDGVVNAYCIDSNNVVRFLRLYREVAGE